MHGPSPANPMQPQLTASSSALAALLFVVAPDAAAHDLTPSSVVEIPVELDPMTGSVIFAQLLGPATGEHVWHAELHLQWTNTGPTSASAFELELSMPLAGGPSAHWIVDGTQCGWGAGPGVYTCVVSSDALDGEAGSFFGLGIASISLELDAQGGGGLWGQLSNSKLVLFLGPSLSSNTTSLSLATGGTQQLELAAGPTVGPGLPYLVLGSASGTAPGIDALGVHVPLNLDAYTMFTLGHPNTPPLVRSLGLLDAQGRANAAFKLPPAADPSLAGITVQHSFLLLDGSSFAPLSASNAVALQLTP